jgi:hypothetical protein
MNSRALLLIAVLLLIAGGLYYFLMRTPETGITPVATTTPSGTSSGGATTTPRDADELCVDQGGTWNAEVNECVLPLIIVASPSAGDLVTSPLLVL